GPGHAGGGRRLTGDGPRLGRDRLGRAERGHRHGAPVAGPAGLTPRGPRSGYASLFSGITSTMITVMSGKKTASSPHSHGLCPFPLAIAIVSPRNRIQKKTITNHHRNSRAPSISM